MLSGGGGGGSSRFTIPGQDGVPNSSLFADKEIKSGASSSQNASKDNNEQQGAGAAGAADAGPGKMKKSVRLCGECGAGMCLRCKNILPSPD